MHYRHRPPSRTSASMQPPHHPTQFPYYPPHRALAQPRVPYVRVDEVEEVAAWDVGQHEGLQRRLGGAPGGGREEVQEGRDGGVRYVLPTAIKFKLGEGGRKGKGKGGGGLLTRSTSASLSNVSAVTRLSRGATLTATSSPAPSRSWFTSCASQTLLNAPRPRARMSERESESSALVTRVPDSRSGCKSSIGEGAEPAEAGD